MVPIGVTMTPGSTGLREGAIEAGGRDHADAGYEDRRHQRRRREGITGSSDTRERAVRASASATAHIHNYCAISIIYLNIIIEHGPDTGHSQRLDDASEYVYSALIIILSIIAMTIFLVDV
jgi:hypothetical protein